MISYEYPLSERIRTLLRLEDLYERALYFIAKADPQEHHVALLCMFEILEVAGRADLKSDLLQELERQKQSLESLRDNPDISQEALDNILWEIDRTSSRLFQMSGKVGQELRENEWLMSIKNRIGIPGGVCEFDLPSYHFWLNRSPEQRQRDIDNWVQPMLPIRQGIAIVLRLLRASGRPEAQVAVRGSYQLMLAGRTTQMIRLRVHRTDPYVPEIGANKYALNIRFLTPDTDMRPKQADVDVRFELTFCNL